MIILGTIDPPTAQTLRGHVDVYCQHGRTVGRKWPYQQQHPPTPAQEETRLAMKIAMAHAWGSTPWDY